jgi:transposase InsO family protein
MFKVVRILWNDNGQKYVSNEYTNFCVVNGIQRQFTTPYSFEQNGVSNKRIELCLK